MARRRLDANVIIRHLTGDSAVLSPRATALVRRLERGEAHVDLSPVIIAEVVFVLSSTRLYAPPRSTIRDGLLPILMLRTVHTPRKRLYRRIFELYVSLSVDFEDAYEAALAERTAPHEIYSFDRDLDRIPTVRRVEP